LIKIVPKFISKFKPPIKIVLLYSFRWIVLGQHYFSQDTLKNQFYHSKIQKMADYLIFLQNQRRPKPFSQYMKNCGLRPHPTPKPKTMDFNILFFHFLLVFYISYFPVVSFFTYYIEFVFSIVISNWRKKKKSKRKISLRRSSMSHYN
jgi:hypothetical protein